METFRTSETLAYAPHNFEWPRCPEGEKFFKEQLDLFLEKHPFARTLRDRMLAETSTRMIDWIDHMDLTLNVQNLNALGLAGFRGYRDEGRLIYWHPHAQFPRIILHSDQGLRRLALHVENIENFQRANNLTHIPMEGIANGRYRHLSLPEGEHELAIIERRGYQGFAPDKDEVLAGKYRQARERWKRRERLFDDENQGMQATLTLTKELTESVGPDLAADAVLAEERNYWESRNHAASTQKTRQDAMGLGWANHDHHTFRGSREHFVQLMEIFHTLGFKKRERYYAGDKAGWGAQILEQPTAKFVVFADVDLLPEEKTLDFSIQPLPPLHLYNTVGLWCALHGESILQGGMHHLEAQFDFDRLREDLLEEDIITMKPFSDFPHLRQAFTHGEIWAVDPRRLGRLRDSIDATMVEKFAREGAIGSHLENLQRREGYKGFNQDGVDAILRAVNPTVIARTQGEAQENIRRTITDM